MAKLNTKTISITVSEMVRFADQERELITPELLETLEEVITTMLGKDGNILVEIDTVDTE